ncbi:uncharacterized protein BP01DRAFT_91390 [Aspergillus saccharolyticus JOP 1030-1]|uniref:Uncharacterized protein n=1 Tax=Aspergillus saccharolyticus JOP 1030-1 TaxID=1450539 RepID=A0A318Z9Q5_9EURO|nr:hypothetical protein BP01DRAFT_91390 [Aspergillus saccharolyticus JOP 1030-1]PYH43969.1 hypothetical protein BP01DRAFT_91390 [Aspergillus saccharolyticus JOP 1030-1]
MGGESERMRENGMKMNCGELTLWISWNSMRRGRRAADPPKLRQAIDPPSLVLRIHLTPLHLLLPIQPHRQTCCHNLVFFSLALLSFPGGSQR